MIYRTIEHVDVLIIQLQRTYDPGHLGFKTETLHSLEPATKQIKEEFTVGFINVVNDPFLKVNKTILSSCRAWFNKVIEKVNPTYLIPMGSMVFTFITGKAHFSSWVGREIYCNGFKVIPIYHPDFAVKTKENKRDYEIHLQILVKNIFMYRDDKNKNKYELITIQDKMIKKLDWLCSQNSTVQSFDYETTDLNPHEGVPTCISISWGKGQAVCMYWFNSKTYCDTKSINIKDYVTKELYNALQRWLTSSVKKVIQNVKFEYKWTVVHFNCKPYNVIWDTKQVHHLLQEETSTKLSDLAYIYTEMGGYDVAMQEFLDSDKNNRHWMVSPDFMLPYSAGDADCTLQIYIKQNDLMNKDPKLSWLYKNVVHPGIFVISEIELAGMKIDVERFNLVKTLLEHEINICQSLINLDPAVTQTLVDLNINRKTNKAVTGFNVNSPVQVSHLLYKVLKLPVFAESKKTGNPKTDSETLKLLKDRHEIVKRIMKFRSFTYQLGDLEQIKSKMRKDDTVFSDLVQDYVLTGRLASRNPNLQNIKGETEDELSFVKQCFISRWEKGTITQADFSQIELRLSGSEAQEDQFLSAFENNVDLHSVTASNVFKIDLPDFLLSIKKYKKERDVGKRINFGVVYGITEYGLSVQLSITKAKAKQYIDSFWKTNPKLKKWMEANEKEVLANLQIRNRLGRIRHLPDVVSENRWVRESALRQASNFKIQSLCADILMWCLVNIYMIFNNRKLKSLIIGQIHDSILIDTYPGEESEVKKILHEVMEVKTKKLFTFLKSVLKVDINSGIRWSDV